MKLVSEKVRGRDEIDIRNCLQRMLVDSNDIIMLS
jgi:hypothetical protein